MTGERRLTPLAVRLAAAFAAVAVVGVAVFAALIVVVADRETTALGERAHRDDTRSAAVALADAYRAADGWEDADLTAAVVVAARAHAEIAIRDADGNDITTPVRDYMRMMEEMHGVAVLDDERTHPVSEPVLVDGRRVGDVTLTFPLSGTPAQHVREVLWRTVVIGASIAAAAAVAVALFVSSRVTKPVAALTDAAGRLAHGDRTARADIAGPGELGTLAMTFDDMAERLETEDRLRRQLVSDIAHELRTPLAILQGETEALLDGVRAADETTLGSLHDEVVRLTRLVADLETLAAADAARLDLDTETVDLADVAARALASIRHAADERGVALAETLAPAQAAGDKDRLQQVVLNLLSNAIKFTPVGGTVSVSTATTDGQATLVVEDTGPGLADGEADHVFDRFWQGTAGQRTATGSGIGLAVASGIVQAHGGRLTAANRTDQRGAVFRLELGDGNGKC